MRGKTDDRPRIRVAISSCLLGQKVRYDGGHKLDTLVTGLLGRHFEWVPVCPETEIGLGTPRESLRVVETAEGPRLVGMRSRDDHTGRMERWAGRKLEALARMGICGCILKKDSPSCGMERVRLYDGKGRVRRTGTGIYAASFLNRFPAMPVEEEGRLRDPGIYDNFVERLFACHRWQEFLVTSPGVADLMSFHARHKLTLASHGDGHYRRLGRLVAGADPRTPKHAIADYGRLLMEALKVRATRKKHANVLYRILGLLKEAADAGDKAELLETIDNYRQGLLPLIVPITLVQHHLRRHPIPWMAEQIYLNPYPAELMLRNSS